MVIKPQKPYYNIDPVSKQIVSDAIYDGYRDETDSLCSRFGLREFTDLATGLPGDGLFWWDKLNKPVAVSGGKAFTFDKYGVVSELTGPALNQGTPTVFAAGQKIDNSAILFCCNGKNLNYSTGHEFTQVGSPAPQNSTHVIYQGLRFLGNEKDTARFYFSDIDPETGEFDPTYWAATENPLTGDTRGDNILGLYQAWEDAAVWGSDGRELWQETGGEPPIEMRGSFCDAGLIAPYSVKRADNTFFALCTVDEKPAVVRLVGNDPQVISLDIERVLDNFSTLANAIGDVISIGGQSFYILTNEGQTWAYNIKKQEWYRWSWWNKHYAEREAFLGRHFIFAKAWGKHLCQSRVDGKIYEVVSDATSDNGNLIATEWVTGWADGGTTEEKVLAWLRIHLKRAQGNTAGSEPVMVFKYRNNGKQEWSNERQISLGKQGQYEFYKTLHSLGQFRSRQFSLRMTDAANLVFAGIEMEFS